MCIFFWLINWLIKSFIGLWIVYWPFVNKAWLSKHIEAWLFDLRMMLSFQDPALGFKEPLKEENTNFKRKLSKREKKEKKRREQELAKQNESVSSKLYTEAPETSFTRSISNPEAVMRRRRQQKLEKKLAQMQSREGGPDSGELSWHTYEHFLNICIQVRW